MAVDIEPLLKQLSALAPRFGRAQDDLNAMVSRGRAGDYKGVMQNARLVLEALLRSLVTEELKQTPGKAMLDELVTKFRQQANAGIVPTNVLAHMGTVQAWGNLSAHDHAGSLDDSGVTVGADEVVASLNSLVAILSWYADKRSASISKTVPAIVRPPPAPSRTPLIAGGALGLLALVGGAAFIMTRTSAPSAIETPQAVGDPFQALNAVYSTRDEPPPPAACRRAGEAAQLAAVAMQPDALELVPDPSAEASYLLARVTFDVRKRRSPALDVALACPDFAAAQHLAGLIAIADEKLPDARKYLEQARRSAPRWLENRARLAGVLLGTGALDEASQEIDGLINAAPDFAPAYLLRFSLRALQGKNDDAMKDLCKARDLGSEQAAKKVESEQVPCP